MTANEFLNQHPDPTTWTSADHETYEVLRHNDAHRQEQDVLRSAGQAITLEAVRHHVEEMQARPPLLDGRPVETGQLVGHLMAAEVLLGQVARAFTPAA